MALSFVRETIAKRTNPATVNGKIRGAAGLLLSLALSGCTTPAQRYDDYAASLGFNSELVETARFRHRIYSNVRDGRNTLHVYLDGDGTPWVRGRWIASDPTARNPLILDLMRLDKSPAIMLGRPCYHGVGRSSVCHPRFWTSHRYSEEVVDSMAKALKAWLKDNDVQRIVLVGYSGGGVLAMLLAPRIERHVALLVTIAANLDIDAWNAYHGYPPFEGSLNPADDLESLPDIEQLHLAGGEDEIVPAFIVSEFAARGRRSRTIEYQEFDHGCCWVDIWPEVLSRMPAAYRSSGDVR